MVSEETLAEITRRLVEGFHPDKIILFGSQARGTADERSDVDILVLCPIKDSRRKLVLDMYDALDEMKVAKDIVILTSEEFELDRQIPGTIAQPAWEEGKVLYEQSRTKD
ncbi:MAG: nucleotidyltransferase domain-containing protein [Candidatus Poribacteria bacterium]|mgnify:CR=1 FL=1